MTSLPQAAHTHNFTQDEFDRFAALSGDDNPIHVSAAFSADTRFGRTVAHGMLLFTRLRGLMEDLVPGARLLGQTLIFPAPTFADEPMEFRVWIKETDDNGTMSLGMEIKRLADNVITCQGTARLCRER